MSRFERVVGVVLAGGRSTRFGAEKAMACVGGEPILVRVLDVLEAGCGRLAINARPGSGAADLAAERRLPMLTDLDAAPDGPLAGVSAGIAWARGAGGDYLATSPCDTPNLPPDLVARLMAALPPGAGAAVARTADGLQPLCAVWRVTCESALTRALASGAHPPVRQVLSKVGGVEVMFEDAPAFANVNTPGDLAELSPSRGFLTLKADTPALRGP